MHRQLIKHLPLDEKLVGVEVKAQAKPSEARSTPSTERIQAMQRLWHLNQEAAHLQSYEASNNAQRTEASTIGSVHLSSLQIDYISTFDDPEGQLERPGGRKIELVLN
jgi:hypothetical protein